MGSTVSQEGTQWYEADTAILRKRVGDRWVGLVHLKTGGFDCSKVHFNVVLVFCFLRPLCLCLIVQVLCSPGRPAAAGAAYDV
jgi:hypothetical protein